MCHVPQMNEQGVAGLYRGLIPSIWGVSETAIQFVLYERLKTILASRHAAAALPLPHAQTPADKLAAHDKKGQDTAVDASPALRNLEYVGAAASAKLVASSVTYPHEVIRTRLRERGASQIYSSALQCVRRVWVEEGVRGLYGGLGTHLLRVVPNTAILFFTYEKVSWFLSDEREKSGGR